jgi:hypothetical protein
MKRFVLAFVTAILATQASAAPCTLAAEEKKLAGAAKASFLKKCQADATSTCESAAADKKLAGAAKNSFMKKCLADAVGPSPTAP